MMLQSIINCDFINLLIDLIVTKQIIKQYQWLFLCLSWMLYMCVDIAYCDIASKGKPDKFKTMNN